MKWSSSTSMDVLFMWMCKKTGALYAELPLISDKRHCGCSDCMDYTKAVVRSSAPVQEFF
ncbi:hypothetical protein ORD22_06245 [Sporosarcina sp. GW1-11]|uniref:hypothetical protein n=1 Tax=Sporosarcina sp. GW1-11 TaxID=2899126 RepID=UPI00294DCF16|nr:hypothetical protein [Sporosarcina sp. GW1-11]MDV6377861.1 hypothetical protein [Sporosarcina sp. GW1-11]